MMKSNTQHDSNPADNISAVSSQNASDLPKTDCSRRFALLFAFFFPVLLTWVYFDLASQWPLLQKYSYSIGKIIQFGFPAVWILLFYRNYRSVLSLLNCSNLPKLRDFQANDNSLNKPFSLLTFLEGIGFGFVIASAMVAVFLITRNLPGFTEAYAHLEQDLGTRFANLGLRSPIPFIMVGLFYSLIHSGLEEYYWRWFLYGQLRFCFPAFAAAMIASVGFTLHHIVVLQSYFGITNFLTWLCSFGVCVGGLYWCWHYQRSGNVLGIWLGHGLIDAAIFVVGYLILF
ncbi:MAG: CPBP family intramembrane metalloprotease [Planctomycetia bacterium]|nr:CPBP family intramembrane metalloprotease [Planctomycetia bacterium]